MRIFNNEQERKNHPTSPEDVVSHEFDLKSLIQHIDSRLDPKKIHKISDYSSEATVFLIDDHPQYKKCILKVYKKNKYRDNKIISSLISPETKFIAKLFYCGQYNDIVYEIQEYVDGISLTNLIIDAKLKNDDHLIITMIKQVSDAIKFLHDSNIVHRDLKPDHIIKVNNDALFKVIDFGKSCIVENDYIEIQRENTPQYASPESFKHHVYRAGDWYSFGMILLEIFGENPLNGMDANAVEYHYEMEKQLGLTKVKPESNMNLLLGLLSYSVSSRWTYEDIKRWIFNEENRIQEPETPIFQGYEYPYEYLIDLARGNNKLQIKNLNITKFINWVANLDEKYKPLADLLSLYLDSSIERENKQLLYGAIKAMADPDKYIWGENYPCVVTSDGERHKSKKYDRLKYALEAGTDLITIEYWKQNIDKKALIPKSIIRDMREGKNYKRAKERLQFLVNRAKIITTEHHIDKIHKQGRKVHFAGLKDGRLNRVVYYTGLSYEKYLTYS